METYQPEPQIQQSPSTKPKNGGRCCLWSCLSIVGVFVLTGVCLLMAPTLLRMTGLRGLPADVRYGGSPDIYASEQLQTTLDEFTIEGAEVYVIPEQGTNNQTAFIILDSSAGFTGFTDMPPDNSQVDVNNRVDGILAILVDKNQAHDLRISRVVIDYRDENGENFMSLTTSMEELQDYVAGRLTYDEFYGGLGMDFGKVLTQFLEGVNE
jgi:hypothetical protein